jgi:hypothetical protein
MADGTKEQVLAGVSAVCDISHYLPEIDVVTKLDITRVFMAKSHGQKPLPIRSSVFTPIGITGSVAAGKLAVTFDSGTVMTMYIALYKPKTAWTIVQIATDKSWSAMFPPPPPPPQRQQ